MSMGNQREANGERRSGAVKLDVFADQEDMAADTSAELVQPRSRYSPMSKRAFTVALIHRNIYLTWQVAGNLNLHYFVHNIRNAPSPSQAVCYLITLQSSVGHPRPFLALTLNLPAALVVYQIHLASLSPPVGNVLR